MEITLIQVCFNFREKPEKEYKVKNSENSFLNLVIKLDIEDLFDQ